MTKQNELRALYEKHWMAIDICIKKYPGLSGPILMNIPESYFNSKKKLMIIGQQTFGWDIGDIDKLLKCYFDFNFAENHVQSPFWNMTKKITEILGISRFSIAWTNLIKCDFNDGSPPDQISDEIFKAFPVLKNEIEILTPEIIVFFTGHSNDGKILQALPGSNFNSVPNYTDNVLSRVVNSVLPINSIRTHHPKYLRMSGNEETVLEYFKLIIKQSI